MARVEDGETGLAAEKEGLMASAGRCREEACEGDSRKRAMGAALGALVVIIATCIVVFRAQSRPKYWRVESTKPTVTFISAETRGTPLLVRVSELHGNFSSDVINLGEGHKWVSYRTKVELLQAYLKKRLAHMPPYAEGNDLIAFIDGSDVIWGGCSEEDFLNAYLRIAEASGAPIVFSAEVVCGEQDCNAVPDVPRWAEGLADGKKLNDGFWSKWNEGCHGTWSDECSARRDCGGLAPCSVPPSVKFLNSGFFMGPVRAMSEMLDWTLANYDNTSVWGDQSPLAVYWLSHQDKVVLDYASELAASLSDLQDGYMRADNATGLIYNQAFDRVQCLVHGNGRGIWWLKDVVHQLTNHTLAEICQWCLKDTGP